MSGRVHNQSIIIKDFDEESEYYYHTYVDQYSLGDAVVPDDDFDDEEFFVNSAFINPILDGEKIEYLLDGMLMENDCTFDTIRKIDSLMNDTPIYYESECDEDDDEDYE